jgi:hypothetical protein
VRKTALLALVLATSPALAQNRYDVSNLSCERVHAILQAQGSAILQYRSKRNPSLVLYDRYVGSAGCSVGRQTTFLTSIPVAGGRSCRVKKCVRTESD